MPWEKKSKESKTVLTEEAVATVGALQHFRIVTKPDALTQEGQWQTAATWAKTYASQTNVLHWCDEQSILYCGLDSGVIHRYKCVKEKQLVQM